MTHYVSSVALDPSDNSVWAGMAWGMGVSRLSSGGGKVADYSGETFGNAGANATIGGIQGAVTAGGRRMAVSFRAQKAYAGAVGIYRGR